MLQEVIDAAEGTDGAAEEKNELDELKLLLPDIREKVEDAKESQKTASAASQAIQQTLVGTQDGEICTWVYSFSSLDLYLILLSGWCINFISIPL